MNNDIQSILIANRGEIAVRVIHTAKKLGITVFAVYAEQDKKSLHVKKADQAFSLGHGSLHETYLNIEKIIDIAKNAGANAIHPGYGFLSENSRFALACQEAGIIFIGPSASAIQTMGNKLEAATFTDSIGVPILNLQKGSPQELMEQTSEKDMPVMIKAASGGGGKGMRLVRNYSDLKNTLLSTSREAKSYFGDGTVYLEKFLENPKHIEVQVLCDNHGNCIHLFERECSVQRRHQKIIEEAPSPTLSQQQRINITRDAVRIAESINYSGAGTVEFLVDEKGKHYFLEMNTRIQVEHPVTEMITGVDIVEEQIEIARNNPLRYTQEDLNINGHAVEARVYAENPVNDFLPSPGNISYFEIPQFKHIRIDSSIENTASISPDYDPLIAKVSGWGADRKKAINQLRNALKKALVIGIKHNLPYLQKVLEHHSFINNTFTTNFIPEYHQQILQELNLQYQQADKLILMAAFISIHSQPEKSNHNTVWESIGYWRTLMKWSIIFDEKPHEIFFKREGSKITLFYDNKKIAYTVSFSDKNKLTVQQNKHITNITYGASTKGTELVIDRLNYILRRKSYQDIISNKKQQTENGKNEKHIKSPMFGKVLSINVKKDSTVKKGETLLVLEAMKMENNIQAPFDTQIKEINVKEGEQVEDGQILLQTALN
jgi:3-methylcrotonyl-CoA carboxylase alpha subunit